MGLPITYCVANVIEKTKMHQREIYEVSFGQGKGNGKGKGKGSDGDSASVQLSFGRDSDVIREYYRGVPASKLPPGLAKRGDLPPGLAKQLKRNGHLPPGLEKKIYPFPVELERRRAVYVARILDGARLQELPIEQPSRIQFVLNLETAKALGLNPAHAPRPR